MIEVRSYTLRNDDPPHDVLSERITQLARERKVGFVYHHLGKESEIWTVHTLGHATAVIGKNHLFPVTMHGNTGYLNNDESIIEELLQTKLIDSSKTYI